MLFFQNLVFDILILFNFVSDLIKAALLKDEIFSWSIAQTSQRNVIVKTPPDCYNRLVIDIVAPQVELLNRMLVRK